jgi:hypothetical protein
MTNDFKHRRVQKTDFGRNTMKRFGYASRNELTRLLLIFFIYYRICR